ncbi:Cystinosin/ERS1p repeat protein [Rhodoplanes sp. Z2-YC6860]|nr:Cystinosin/ERS1p repeat protein [Rhodoplanes sp. Z2-YC6860]
MDLTTAVGGFAAAWTTISYFPQLKKCWETGETGDLSIGMLITLIAGLSTWVVYGILRGDVVVITANCISVCLLSAISAFKVKEMLGDGAAGR